MHADWLKMKCLAKPPLDAVPRGIGRSDIVRALDEFNKWREAASELLNDWQPDADDVGTAKWALFELVCDDNDDCPWCIVYGEKCQTCIDADEDEHADNARRAGRE